MANAFWNRLVDTNAAGGYISPEHFKASLLAVVGSGSLTIADVRTQYGLTTGTEAGTEFGDLVTVAQTLPGTGATGRQLKAYVIDKIVSAARLANSTLTPNPWVDGNGLRLEARAVLLQEGATLSGSLVSAT